MRRVDSWCQTSASTELSLRFLFERNSLEMNQRLNSLTIQAEFSLTAHTDLNSGTKLTFKQQPCCKYTIHTHSHTPLLHRRIYYAAWIQTTVIYGGPKGRLSRLMPSSLTNVLSSLTNVLSSLTNVLSSLTNVSRKLLWRVLRLRDTTPTASK